MGDAAVFHRLDDRFADLILVGESSPDAQDQAGSACKQPGCREEHQRGNRRPRRRRRLPPRALSTSALRWSFDRAITRTFSLASTTPLQSARPVFPLAPMIVNMSGSSKCGYPWPGRSLLSITSGLIEEATMSELRYRTKADDFEFRAPRPIARR